MIVLIGDSVPEVWTQGPYLSGDVTHRFGEERTRGYFLYAGLLTHICNVSLCNGDSVRPAGVVKTLTLAISRLI